MLKALGTLSAYIKHSLETGHSICIAQKGRAKDGNDQTDPAILKCSTLKDVVKNGIFRLCSFTQSGSGFDFL